MKMHQKEAPVGGETLLETRIQSDLSLKTALSVRIVSELASSGLIREDEREKFEICCEEAIKNAMAHGNGRNPALWVTVRVFRDAGEWGISVHDQGSGFSEKKLPEPDDTCLLWVEEGRGIQLMEHVMDRVEYFSGGRNLVLSKRIRDQQAPSLLEGKERAEPVTTRFLEKKNALVARLALPSKDEVAVDLVFKSLLASIERKGLRVLVIDLTDVPYMTSHAIGRLISLYKTCVRTRLCLRLTGVSRDLEQVFTETRLNTLFSCYEGVEEAIAAPLSR